MRYLRIILSMTKKMTHMKMVIIMLILMITTITAELIITVMIQMMTMRLA